MADQSTRDSASTGTVPAGGKRRGRPPGSVTKRSHHKRPTPSGPEPKVAAVASPQGTVAAISQEQSAPEAPAFQVAIPRSPVAVPQIGRPVNRKKAQEQAVATSAVLLTILDGVVGVALGEGARMTTLERELIEEPLARIMARLDPGTSAALERWTDPVLLIFGLGTWGIRVASEMADGEDNPGAGPSDFDFAPEPPKPPSAERDNGVPPANPPTELTDQLGAYRTVIPEIVERTG